MDDILKDTAWVIRSAGERTTEACRAIIEEFVSPNQVTVIQEVPFSNAILKTFQIGAASGKKWTVCIDADVLIYKERMLELLDVAETVDPHIWYVQGLTVDKFIPIIRPAGNGIYRNSMVKKAMRYIPQDGKSLRPESTTMQGMIAAGHLMYRTNIIVGMHDFEQYFADIYRKTFLHAKKHRNVLKDMLAYWERMKVQDEDFTIALFGAETGKDFKGTMKIDKRFKQKKWQKICERKDITEKESLPPREITPKYIEDFIATFKPNMALQMKKFPEYDQSYLVRSRQYSWKHRLRKSLISVFGLKVFNNVKHVVRKWTGNL